MQQEREPVPTQPGNHLLAVYRTASIFPPFLSFHPRRGLFKVRALDTPTPAQHGLKIRLRRISGASVILPNNKLEKDFPIPHTLRMGKSHFFVIPWRDLSPVSNTQKSHYSYFNHGPSVPRRHTVWMPWNYPSASTMPYPI